MSPRTSFYHVLTTGQGPQTEFFEILFHRCCYETHMNASFSGVSPDTAQGFDTCVHVSQESDPSGTDDEERRAVAVVRL